MEENFQLISLWLGGKRNFEAGVEIYNRLGDNYILKMMFEGEKDALLEEELLTAMNDLLILFGKQTPEETKQEVIEKAVEFVANVENHNIRPSDLPNAPVEIKKARAQRKNLYAEYLRCKAQLEEYVPQDIRKEAALRILDIMDEIKPIWDLTNYYDIYLRMPEHETKDEKKLEDLTDIELNKLYESHYKYVRKFQSDEKKREKCIERITEAEKIKNLLIDNVAFFHEKLSFPSFA